ncbi:MAG: hypothetical protein JF615_15060 [Asticcacaulis sp.]|nr:hypothetical protein [Asticcacaulis sp.]
MFRVVVLAGLLLADISTQAQASDRDCSTEARNDAKAIAGSLDAWSDLYRYYRVYPSCSDHDAAAKRLSNAVAGLMVGQWDDLDEVRSFLRQDKEFSDLVLNQVNGDWDKDKIAPVRLNATEHCPKGLETFCSEVVARLDEVKYP